MVRPKADGGFTLIELLVVMIVIGILAAIAIPVFLNQRQKAEDSAAKADVSTLGKEIAAHYVDGDVAPVIGVSGSQWTVNGETVGTVSANVVLESQTYAGALDWCIVVHNDRGRETTTTAGGASFSAQDGLSIGADACG